MSKISTLDLRNVTQRRLAQREICEIVLPIIPDLPYRGTLCKHDYAKRLGFFGAFYENTIFH